MKDRDCETCVHAHPFGGENDNRCDAWECEYINRMEAIKAYIDLVRCEECIYNTDNTDGDNSGWCYKHGIDIIGFCSEGERNE